MCRSQAPGTGWVVPCLRSPIRTTSRCTGRSATTCSTRPSGPTRNGCVNLEDEIAFARAVLEHDRNPAAAKLDDWLASWRSRRVRLRRPLPLFIEYQTTVVDDDGGVRFLPDIYGRDGRAFQRVSLEPFRAGGRAPEDI